MCQVRAAALRITRGIKVIAMMNVRRATAAEGRLRVDFGALRGWSHATHGRRHQAKTRSGAPRLPQVETILKRAIPALIVAFLSVVAASHIFGMMSEYSRMGAAARHATALSAAAAAAVFSDADALFEAGNAAEAQAKLTKFLPQDRLDTGSFVLLVQASGKVFAASTAGISYVGSNVGDFFPEVSAIRRFGDRAGVIETTISGDPHYAEISLVGTTGGYIIAATSLDQIGKLWREELTLNVTLFAGISSILLVIQIGRAHV